MGAIVRGSGEVSEDIVRQFDAWWTVQVAHASRPPPPTTAHMLTPSHHPHPHPHTPSHPLALDKLQTEPLHPALQVSEIFKN